MTPVLVQNTKTRTLLILGGTLTYIYIYIYIYIIYIYIYIYKCKWPEVIHDTQSAEISQKQDEPKIFVIMKTMCPPAITTAALLCPIVRLVGTWCVIDEHKDLRYC